MSAGAALSLPLQAFAELADEVADGETHAFDQRVMLAFGCGDSRHFDVTGVVLKNDKRAIFSAASHAQRAADYLHGLQPSLRLTPEAAKALG